MLKSTDEEYTVLETIRKQSLFPKLCSDVIKNLTTFLFILKPGMKKDEKKRMKAKMAEKIAQRRTVSSISIYLV